MKIKWLNLTVSKIDSIIYIFSDILFYSPHVLQCVDTLKETVLGLSSIEVPAAKILQEAALNQLHLCCFRDRRGEKNREKGEL